MKKNLPPPSNWSDFENLCLKLWGVLWGIPNSIDFNSTNSQGQNGVDIAARPKGESNIWGIQCKNKSLFLKSGIRNKLSLKVIQEEIERAKTFKPSLEKLLIVTSSYKDKNIEEAVRVLSLKNQEEGSFEIEVYFWEFIESKIQEIPFLLNWYLKKMNLGSFSSVEILFNNQSSEISYSPEFVKEKLVFRPQTEDELQAELEVFRNALQVLKDDSDNSLKSKIKSLKDKISKTLTFQKNKPRKSNFARVTINGEPIKRKYPREKPYYNAKVIKGFDTYGEIKESLEFKLLIRNTGATAIENYKIEFHFEGKFKSISVQRPKLQELIGETYQTHTISDQKTKLYIEPKSILVQEDIFISETVFLYPNKEIPDEIKINWKLISKDYSDSGILNIYINPEYLDKEKVMYIEPNSEPYIKFNYRNKYGKIQHRLNV